MITVNYSGKGEGTLDMNYTLSSLGAAAARGEESMVERVENLRIHAEDFERLSGKVKYVTTTERFKDVIKTFNVQKGEIPAGFRVETTLLMDGTLHTDLIRDISL